MTMTDLIPCPLCDALPFDDPADLAEHLSTDCAGRGTATAYLARRDPVRVAETFAPVRTNPDPPAPTRDLLPTPAPRRTTANPCSDKQVNFITSLCARTGADLPDFATLGKREASALIDDLKNRPATAKPAPTAPTAPTSDGPTLQHGGVYATADGTFIKAVESKAGNLYGKSMDDTGKFTVYQPGLLKLIVRDLTAEEAAAFGHLHHRCVFCARKLTDENDGRSVDVGYGPICADKYGLPWG